MKKRRKVLAIASVLLVAAGLWTWRFITLNNFYHGLVGDMGEDKVYAIGDVVPMDNYAEGYSLRVDDFEIAEYEDIDPDIFAKTYAARKGIEGKVCLLSITLFNTDSDEDGFELEYLRLRGEDNVFTVEGDSLKDMNPILERRTKVTLSKGDSCSFVLPYFIYKAQFPTGWTHLDRYSLYMIVTLNSDIRLQ